MSVGYHVDCEFGFFLVSLAKELQLFLVIISSVFVVYDFVLGLVVMLNSRVSVQCLFVSMDHSTFCWREFLQGNWLQLLLLSWLWLILLHGRDEWCGLWLLLFAEGISVVEILHREWIQNLGLLIIIHLLYFLWVGLVGLLGEAD